MIRFACRCRNVLQTPDDQAGLTVQCPACGLLVDVPLMSDKDNLEGDGTYRVGSPAAARPDDRFDQLAAVYHPGRQRPDGTDIDLRGPVQSDQVEPGAPPPDIRERPKYDPETGELMRPLPVEDASVAPIPHRLPEARRVIDYSVSPDALTGSRQGAGVFLELFQPLNVIVMVMITAIHVLLLICVIATMVIPLFIVLPLLILMFLVGHYATVLEEMGPAERDELPRPLRNVHPFDDFLAPFGRTAISLLLCYWPMGVVLTMNFTAAMNGRALPFPMAGNWLIGLFVAGSIPMAAVFLTVCTSGTLLNLRPDRVLRLMFAAGWRYPLFVVLWILAAGTYFYGVVGTTTALADSFTSTSIWLRSYVVWPTLLLGVYLTHAFCWLLGLFYRRSWSTFPWIAQVHERKTASVRTPNLHPKVAASDEKSAARARNRIR